jgi:hypothetical protein
VSSTSEDSDFVIVVEDGFLLLETRFLAMETIVEGLELSFELASLLLEC